MRIDNNITDEKLHMILKKEGEKFHLVKLINVMVLPAKKYYSTS